MCDGGTVDGNYLEGLMYTVMNTDVPIVSAMRVQGNQIGRQRQQAFDTWIDRTEFEWSLWVDSDIALTQEALAMVWNCSDALERPAVSGTYFVTKDNQKSLPKPFPALFHFTDSKYQIRHVHPLPTDKIMQVDAAGFGFLLLHRSVGERMRAALGNIPFFNETGMGGMFISEDINFFYNMKEANVPLFAHTGATVAHIKRFALDAAYYGVYWGDDSKENTEVEDGQ